jgi:hypothetical protein
MSWYVYAAPIPEQLIWSVESWPAVVMGSFGLIVAALLAALSFRARLVQIAGTRADLQLAHEDERVVEQAA